jgi:hypothetical protein
MSTSLTSVRSHCSGRSVTTPKTRAVHPTGKGKNNFLKGDDDK